MKDKKTYFFIWILSIIGSLAVIPYIWALGIISPETPVWQTLLVTTAQSMILFGIVCWLGYKIIPKTDLRPFETKDPLKQILLPGLIGGIVIGFVIYFADFMIFGGTELARGGRPPFWIGVLGSFYGAINEEVLLRLFLLSLIYWLFCKMFKLQKSIKLLWIANIIVALIFGIGHLPAAFSIIESPSVIEIGRIVLLNAFAGVVFGYLYASRGLWTAMAAHFIADLILHVIPI